MRLNLGCGDRYAEGWTNVDLPTTPQRVDMTCDLRGELPWKPLSVVHVYAGHVFEHITPEEGATLLTRLLDCMVYCGEIMVVGPDIPTAQRMLDDGAGLADMHGATMSSLLYGAGRWNGDVHYWAWSSRQMAEIMRSTGWVDVKELPIDDVGPYWPVAERRPQWQRAIHAKRACA